MQVLGSNVRRQKPRLLVVSGLAMILVLATGCMSTNQSKALDLLNRDRVVAHRKKLAADEELNTKAQAWSAKIAAAGKLSHSDLGKGVTGCFHRLSENVGNKRTIAEVEKAFIADVGINPPIHRINIQNAAFDHVGIGVTYKNGYYWVVQQFKDAC